MTKLIQKLGQSKIVKPLAIMVSLSPISQLFSQDKIKNPTMSQAMRVLNTKLIQRVQNLPDGYKTLRRDEIKLYLGLIIGDVKVKRDTVGNEVRTYMEGNVSIYGNEGKLKEICGIIDGYKNTGKKDKILTDKEISSFRRDLLNKYFQKKK